MQIHQGLEWGSFKENSYYKIYALTVEIICSKLFSKSWKTNIYCATNLPKAESADVQAISAYMTNQCQWFLH